MKPKITVLHLSDLQSGNEHCWWAPRLSDKTPPRYGNKFHLLIVEQINVVVDLILVTGDVAERGESGEYGAALRFLNLLRKELKDKFSVNPEICVIPGNHDIDRKQCGKWENGSDEERFDAKFGAYNDFVKMLDETLCVRFDKPFVFQAVERKDGEHKIRLELLGLNSCMKESNLEQDHHGSIGDGQLVQMHSFLKGVESSPYSLRVAAFHHNPLLHGQATGELVEAIYAAAPDGEVRRLALDLRNYLHESRSVLTSLAEHGFHVALHGHQHIDDVITVGFPGRYGEPFARSAVSCLGAGSAGLRQGTPPQSSVASALLLTFEPITWGWQLESRRITIAVQGQDNPAIQIKTEDAQFFILPRAQPLEAITAVARVFSNGWASGLIQEQVVDDVILDSATDHELDQFVLWRATQRRTKLQNFGGHLLESGIVEHELGSDLRNVLLHGLKTWATGNFYGDDLTYALRGLSLAQGTPSISLRVERFAETAILNWGLKKRLLETSGDPISFREKWILPKLKCAELLLKEFPFLSWRCETTVVATVSEVRGINKHRQLLVRVRADEVGTEPGAVSVFASGGCRPLQSKRYQFGDYARDAAAELAESVKKELERETGYNIRDWDSEMTLVGLYLDPLCITPVWLYWLEFDRASFGVFEESSARGRDEWESAWKYKRVPICHDSWRDLRKDVLKTTGATRMTGDAELGLRTWFQWIAAQPTV